jgi:putative endonuclease
MPYYVYVLYSQSLDKYYIGSTQDLENRLLRHNSGRSKYTKPGLPWDLVYAEEYPTRPEAVRRERRLKSWKDRSMLENLVRTDPS